MEWTAGKLAKQLHVELYGDDHQIVDDVASLENAHSTDLSFMLNERHVDALRKTCAAVVVIERKWLDFCPVSALIVENPHLVFSQAAELFRPRKLPSQGIHPTAIIDPTAQCGLNVSIGAYSVIGSHVSIGDGVEIGPGCIIQSNVSIGSDTRLTAQIFVDIECLIGHSCLLHPGVVIGADGFGFARDGSQWRKVPQLGRVIIGDQVEIGANTTIDRGALDDTVIESGVKLDNQIQVAHNVHIGADSAIAGCVGIAGSASIGQRCTIGGGVGIAGHLVIEDDVHVTGMSLVAGNLAGPGVYSSSLPAQPRGEWRKNAVRLRHLHEMEDEIKHLRCEIQKLQQRAGCPGTDNKTQG